MRSERKDVKEEIEETYSDDPLIVLLFTSYNALKGKGWREACYAPRDHPLLLIEIGSTGVHKGQRDKEGRFWIFDEFDVWPSNPILFKLREVNLEGRTGDEIRERRTRVDRGIY